MKVQEFFSTSHKDGVETVIRCTCVTDGKIQQVTMPDNRPLDQVERDYLNIATFGWGEKDTRANYKEEYEANLNKLIKYTFELE